MPLIKTFIDRIVEIILPRPTWLKNLENLDEAGLFQAVSRPRAIHDDLAIHALFDYRNELMRKMIWQLKYRGNRTIALLFARCLFQELLAEMEDLWTFENFLSPLIIPIPLSKKRFRERGYNQTELILEEMKKLDVSNIFGYSTSILTKIKHTTSQTSMKRQERMINLKHCFQLKKPIDILDRNIILFDDVTTTGTTLCEARRTLLSAGARKVLCIAIAH